MGGKAIQMGVGISEEKRLAGTSKFDLYFMAL